MPLVEQKLPTLPEHLSSSPVFSGVRVPLSLDLCVCFVDRFFPFVLFLLTIVLSVLLRYTNKCDGRTNVILCYSSSHCIRLHVLLFFVSDNLDANI